MRKIYDHLIELIGNTPLLRLHKYAENKNLNAKILGKLEFFNPTGSVKDRAALAMVQEAEKRGLIKKGGLIIEATSGNTGIGLAGIAASRGYQLILTMPETMSVERQKLLKAYGAEIILTGGKKGMAGAIEKARELALSHGNAYMPGQFENPANPAAHKKTTGPEIWEDAGGGIDIFIAGVGTGGTLSGAGEYLKEKNPGIKIIAVEPSASPVISGGKAGPHGIQGIGAGFVPKVLNMKIIDEVIIVTDEEAVQEARLFAKTEGMLVGISSGAALSAAVLLAQRKENKDKTIVIILPDGGERYLSARER